MKKISNNAQGGYVLVLSLLALMAMGGVVIAGYTQAVKRDVDTSRYNHNKRVLEQAKQALLMFAYNYPASNTRGPGRLPCPDHDNDGDIDFPLDCDTVGRFPWKDPRLNIQETLDADGQRLWYAVSSTFDNKPNDIVDPNSVGTITLVDQSGVEIYDGAVAGIAAVIIAPGSIVKRDNDDNGTYEFTQLRGIALQRNDPRNYLDTFNGFDNSVFTNLENDPDDGFILGPIYDDNVNDYVVNDQLIIVTTAEVMAMAEQSVLDTYQRAINTYLDNTGGIYPWLDSFATNDLDLFDADLNTFKGRLPAIFSSYFSGQEVDPYASETRIRMELQGDIVIYTPAAALTEVSFDVNGDLVTTLDSFNSVTRYFWDGHPTEADTLPMDGVWEMCPLVTGTEEDCNQDDFGVYIGGSDSEVWLQVYKATMTLNSGADPLEFPYTELVSAGPYVYIPATASEQAYVFGNYRDSVLTDISINWEYDLNFRAGFNVQTFGGLVEVAIGVVYYPELPAWALSDGWHHSVQMAIAEDYKPNGNNADCTVNGCLVVNNLGGVNNDKISLLAIAGEVDVVDEGGDGFFDDLTAQFEAENDTSNTTYDRRAGNDSLLVIQ